MLALSIFLVSGTLRLVGQACYLYTIAQSLLNKRQKSMINRLMRMLILLSSVVLLTACAQGDQISENPGAQFKGQSEQKLFKQAQLDVNNGSYRDAIKKLEALQALYPFGKHAKFVQLDLIYAYYQKPDLAQAIAAASRFLHLYPTSQYAGYAYYMRGLAHFYQSHDFLSDHLPIDYAQRNLHGLQQSFLDLKHVVKHYPHTRYAHDAHQRLIYIRNLMAQSLLEKANFYYKRQAYVAASNRSVQIIEHYQRTPAVKGALIVLAKSYEQLGLDQQTQQVARVGINNFPHDKTFKRLASKQLNS